MAAKPAASSPYYSLASFALFGPLSFIYSLTANLYFRVLTKVYNRQIPSIQSVTPPRLCGRTVAIVTGSNTGIGFETARSLVLEHDVTVILACRSRDKGEQAAARINNRQRKIGSDDSGSSTSTSATAKAVFLQPLDLTSTTSIRDFGRALQASSEYRKVHILVNNAGRNTNGVNSSNNKNNATDELMVDTDLLFQSNFLGHFLLTAELLRLNVLAEQARVVNLSSVMHHFCKGPVESVEYWRQCGLAVTVTADSTAATATGRITETYSPSKLAAQLFTNELNRRYASRLRSIAVNPGAVNSDIWRDFPRVLQFVFQFIYLDSRQGCCTSVAAAVGEWDDSVIYLQPYWLPAATTVAFPAMEILGVFQGYRVTQPRLPADGGLQAGQALWKASLELTGAAWPSEQK